MKRVFRWVLSFGVTHTAWGLYVSLVAGCALLSPDFEAPSVSVISFKPVLSQSLEPRFEIGMRVVNPNSKVLNLRGMSYKIYLNGYKIVEGASNELPSVPAYGEATVKLVAMVSLVEAMRLLQDLLRTPENKVGYRFQAVLDVGAMIPSIRVEKTGSYGL
jgi:LEA14-like dessication related protein